MTRHLLASTLALGLLVAGAAALRAQAPSRSTNDGVYSAAQAERGKRVFEARCTACHEAERFKGSEFVSNWSKEPLFSIFDMVSATMPADNPGGLPAQDYADVIAMMLQQNGFPAGTDDLQGSKDVMSAIRFDPPHAP